MLTAELGDVAQCLSLARVADGIDVEHHLLQKGGRPVGGLRNI
jgi:hypothetical protein